MRVRVCVVMLSRLLYYFFDFTFEIVEPLIDLVPPKTPHAEESFMPFHLACFLLTALEKLLIC